MVANACGDAAMSYTQIRPFDAMELLPLFRLAASHYDDPRYDEAVAQLPAAQVRTHRANLLYAR